MRKCTGLRNRWRSGKSKYATLKKARVRDLYGEYSQGRCVKPDIIANKTLIACQPQR